MPPSAAAEPERAAIGEQRGDQHERKFGLVDEGSTTTRVHYTERTIRVLFTSRMYGIYECVCMRLILYVGTVLQ
jgi:hypothetical protein